MVVELLLEDSEPDQRVDERVHCFTPLLGLERARPGGGDRYSASCWRRNNRARWTRVFAQATVIPRTSLISRCDRPSTSRSTTSVRYSAGSSSIAVTTNRNSLWADGLSMRADQSATGS